MKHHTSGALTRASLLACASVCAVSSVHAASGIWTGVTSAGLWSDAANWDAATVADGAGSTANFSTLDLPEGDFVVALDTPRTIGSLTFGDTDALTAGSWLIDNNFIPTNILTLSGTPVLTVNALGAILGDPATAEISAVIAGTEGLTKAGAGPLTLSGINTFTGSVAVNAGTLTLGAANVYAGGTTVNTGAILNINAAGAIGSGALTLAGGNIGNTAVGATTLAATNNVQNWNSNFTFSGPSNLNLGAGAVAIPSNITVTVSAGVLTAGGILTGAGTFIKEGAGELQLTTNSATNNTTFTGPMTLKGGIVRLGLNGASPNNNQNGIGSLTKIITFEGGALALNGSTGNNTPTYAVFNNPLVVAAGQTGTVYNTQRGDFNSVLTGSGTFNVIANYVRGNLNGNWTSFTGTINASSVGAGNAEWRVNGTQLFTASTTLNITNASVFQVFNPPSGAAGTTQVIGKLIGSSAAFLGGNPIAGRFVNWQVGGLSQDSEFAGVIGNSTGAARLYKVGTGTLSLTGANTYTGDTQLNGGKLHIGTGGATGSLAATNVITIAGTELVFNRDNSAISTYPGILSGPGNIFKRGTGQVNFNGVNTYTAGTSIQGGTLGINSASSLGNAAGAVSFTVANGGILATAPGIIQSRPFSVATGITASFGAATAADSLEITSNITGAGSLAVSGSGVVTLSSPSSYGGSTTIPSGTLVAANVSGSATSGGSVALNGGRLGGTGIISGAVTAATGTGLKPGPVTPTSSGVGTLTVGSLALAGGSTLFAEFSTVSSYDTVTVTTADALTTTASLANPVMVDLRLSNSVSKWTTPGTYDLFQFSGSFIGDPDDLFEVTPSSVQAGFAYDFNVVGNHVQLVITPPAPPATWNVNASGNWTNAGNWISGPPNAVGAIVQFDSVITGPQSVTLNANQTAGTLQFNNANSYTIDGTSTLTLNQYLTAAAEINVQLGSHTISAPLSLVDPLLINLNSVGDSLSLTGAISGSVGISKASPGNLTLGGNNSFLSGPVSFSNGTLTFANNGLGTGNLTLDNASLIWGAGNTQDITAGRTITFGNNPITFAMESDVTLAGNFGLTGTANLTKDGAGNLTLAANTTFAGNLTVLNGNLNLGDGGADGSTLGGINLVNAASVLTVSRAGDHLIPNLISGAGSLVLEGPGIQSLDKASTFTGTTTISGGTAKLVNGLAFQNSRVLYNSGGGSIDFDLVGAATFGSLEGDKDLTLTNAGSGVVILTTGGNNLGTTYTGVLSGVGGLTKIGDLTMTLTAAQTYTGATQVNNGILELPVGASILTTTSASIGAGDGQILVNGGTLTASALSSIAPGGPNGLRVINGGTATFNGGLVTPNADGGLIYVESGSLTTTTLSFGRTQSYANGVDPVPAAVGNGTGLVAVGGNVLITGTMNIGTSNSSASSLVDGGNVTINGTTTIALDGGDRWSRLEVRSGTFTSTDTSPTGGIVLATKNPDQTRGQFFVSGGTATVERIGFGDDVVNVNNIGRLTVTGGSLYVGSGGLVRPAPSLVTQIQLFGGTIGAKAPWSSSLPITTQNTFTVKAADAADVAHGITLSGAITGTGSLVKTGDGILTLSGAYSYTGSTTVADGTLSLTTAATLNDAAVVDITTGATLNLAHGATDTVFDFLIDGNSQGPGLYDAVSNPGLISGSGKLLVLGAPFTVWIDSFVALTNPADKVKGADPDKDGKTNLQEFALDGDPTSGADAGKVRSRVETVGADQALVITLPVRAGTGQVFAGTPFKAATRDRVIYTVEGSNDLALFNQGVTEIAVSSAGMPPLSGAAWAYHTFRLDGAIPARGTRGFLRVDIEDGDP